MPADTAVSFSRWETAKAATVTAAIVAAFVFSDWPRELIALAGAGLLLMNRRIASADMMKHVDGSLLLMLMGLFIVNAALAATRLPEELLDGLRAHGLNLAEPIPLFVVSSVLSNLVGNSPSVMLVVPFLGVQGNAEALGAALALGTGFSSNFILFGSLAGIIVVEEAAAGGIRISFAEFTRAGVPVAAVCTILAVIWLLLL
jgi:Na+/H+ antiporter NhaD/arsenite permease-like protein